MNLDGLVDFILIALAGELTNPPRERPPEPALPSILSVKPAPAPRVARPGEVRRARKRLAAERAARAARKLAEDQKS